MFPRRFLAIFCTLLLLPLCWLIVSKVFDAAFYLWQVCGERIDLRDPVAESVRGFLEESWGTCGVYLEKSARRGRLWRSPTASLALVNSRLYKDSHIATLIYQTCISSPPFPCHSTNMGAGAVATGSASAQAYAQLIDPRKKWYNNRRCVPHPILLPH